MALSLVMVLSGSQVVAMEWAFNIPHLSEEQEKAVRAGALTMHKAMNIMRSDNVSLTAELEMSDRLAKGRIAELESENLSLKAQIAASERSYKEIFDQYKVEVSVEKGKTEKLQLKNFELTSENCKLGLAVRNFEIERDKLLVLAALPNKQASQLCQGLQGADDISYDKREIDK